MRGGNSEPGNKLLHACRLQRQAREDQNFLYLHPQSLQTNPNQPDIVLLELGEKLLHLVSLFLDIYFTWGKIEEISFAASRQKAHPNLLGLPIH